MKMILRPRTGAWNTSCCLFWWVAVTVHRDIGTKRGLDVQRHSESCRSVQGLWTLRS